jgi:hypothetical protein
MKIWLGDEFDIEVRKKVAWIRSTFSNEQYTIIDNGFLMNDYYVEFTDDSNATLYYLAWNK